MVFSSTVFLFIFLPFVLIVNYLLGKELRNYFLLLVSLFFYSWGEGFLVMLMVTSICINYLCGLLVDHYKQKEKAGATKWVLGIGITINLLFLLYFKYFNFFVDNIQGVGLFSSLSNVPIHLPIGISFFTFQSISYLIDIYRDEAEVQKNPFHLGLYISLFPQLVAGPIVRYQDVATQISKRILSQEKFVEGIFRFIRGLAKKLILANSLGIIADNAFAVSSGDLPTMVAWVGIICYSLQIYFDFSGYSDMAIGLGKMLGFDFLENFNYPYISKSIQEFWRRWHISLSTWFRDYLYIPLGGSRIANWKIYRNLFIVFLVTGFWHGASWNFIVWGLFHGFFLIIERVGFGKVLKSLPNFIGHFYALFVAIIGWVFFKANDLPHAMEYLGAMFGFSNGYDYMPLLSFSNYTLVVFILAVIFSTPIRRVLHERVEGYLERLSNPVLATNLYRIGAYSFTLSLLFASILEIATSSYNPFIYFRF